MLQMEAPDGELSPPLTLGAPIVSPQPLSDQQEDTLVKHVDINIAESEKRANGPLHVRDHYTVYLIDVKVQDQNFTLMQNRISSLWRRYSEFEQLHDYLQATYPYVVMPPLPEKRKSDTLNPEFIDRRRAGLENFLLRVASHPTLCFDNHFIGFLQLEHGWRETVIETGNLVSAEKKLKSLSVTIRLKSPDAKFEMIKSYGKQLESSLSNLLYTRSRMVEKQYTLSKLHSNYGKLFSEWSVIEKEMGDGLQKAGHYFDSIADGIDSILEEEEQFADQLKEYLFFADALQNVCRHHEGLQLAVENAEECLTSRTSERERAAQGKAGLMSRLFGTTDPDIVRDQTCRMLDSKIVTDKSTIEKAHEELKEFTEKALIDIERFQKQKDKDLQETLAGYIGLQVKNAKKGLQAWSQVRDCLESIP
ncbi:sorting nexin-4-like isoform X2 [Arctopsyche grandis]|uniref:sorting nexin-4-like isoform X2 n=1 Tax=Arctopsyche grandis TaxID=121162 RepID=UPI00406D6516